jgi:hypothetical protein
MELQTDLAAFSETSKLNERAFKKPLNMKTKKQKIKQFPHVVQG